MQSFALVDYDNAKCIGKEKNVSQVSANLELIADACAKLRKQHYPAAADLVIRLYGGWVDEYSQFTTLANWLLGEVGKLRGRRSGARVRVELATAIVRNPEHVLIGTFRSNSKPTGQKMVDTMMAADMIYLASISDCPIIVMSDDDDLVPPLLQAKNDTQSILIARQRRNGTGLNDSALNLARLFIATPWSEIP